MTVFLSPPQLAMRTRDITLINTTSLTTYRPRITSMAGTSLTSHTLVCNKFTNHNLLTHPMHSIYSMRNTHSIHNMRRIHSTLRIRCLSCSRRSNSQLLMHPLPTRMSLSNSFSRCSSKKNNISSWLGSNSRRKSNNMPRSKWFSS